mgnify:FL=1
MTRQTNRAEIEIACEIKWETDKAYLIFDGKQTVWIPKSQITDEALDKSSIFMPEWLAIEK